MAGCSLVVLTSLNCKILLQYFWTLKLGSGLNFVGTKKQAEEMSSDSQNSVIAKLRKLSRFNKQSTLIIVASRADYSFKIGELLNFLYLPSPKNDWDRLPSLLRGWVRNHLKPRDFQVTYCPPSGGLFSPRKSSAGAKKRLNDEEMKAAFRIFDRRKKGAITKGDILRVLNVLGQDASKEEINDLMGEVSNAV